MISRIRTLAAVVVMCALAFVAHASETTTYTYDALGRLTQAQVSGGARSGVQQGFGYDTAGNRTSVQTSGPSNPHPSTIVAANTNVNSMGASGGALVVNVGAAGASGSASFSVNGLFVDSVQVTNGQARVVLRGFNPGTYTVAATYSGDANNDPTTTTFTVKVQDLSWLPAVLDLLLSN